MNSPHFDPAAEGANSSGPAEAQWGWRPWRNAGTTSAAQGPVLAWARMQVPAQEPEGVRLEKRHLGSSGLAWERERLLLPWLHSSWLISWAVPALARVRGLVPAAEGASRCS